ncbi:hypothetical protein [Streptomyces sp. NPDC127084]|uniref:hypothetical protein n=1 Tax=Streptomyces sp. NPDC127084 TaxID=3347133 RepID=UPI00366410F7
MSTQTFAHLSAPLLALRQLVVEFGHLPAPCVSVSTIYPNVLELALHNGFADFEAWREALAICPDEVVHRVHGDAGTGALEGHAVFAGVRLRLVAYATLATGEAASAGAGAP